VEREGIDELTCSAKWLVGAEWRLDGDLCLDATIQAHGHDYEVRVSFPSLYPDAPAVVSPRNIEGRISTHQYGGADGPLCLEWGPDNWSRNITATQMLESTHRLFDIENPLGVDRPKVPVVAPSRHRLTVGQILRAELVRWYANKPLADYLAAQPGGSIGSFKFSFCQRGETWIALVHEAMPFEGTAWKDDEIPTTLPGAESGDLHVGVWFKTDVNLSAVSQLCKLAELRNLLADKDAARFLATDGTSPVEGFRSRISGILIMDGAGELHLIIVLSGENIITCSRVQSEAEPIHSRSPQSAILDDKTIGILGLGSAGSKIAISLARMGLRKFFLVDYDVLLPENLRRHALDWQGVVQLKVDAMAEAINRIAPRAQIKVCRLHLAGQESNASVCGALNQLSECDLLIDATANPKVFNLLSGVARIAGRPMVWLEVFGGGIGGLIARSRPAIDPTPKDMHGAYLQYCTENPDLELRSASEDYSTQAENGEVLVASDADVAIIAHNAARFVSDCFIPPERSKFPNSMYLIGLAKGWVFEAPFATIPISMAAIPVSGWIKANKPELSPEDAAFLLGLIQKYESATTSTTGNRRTAG